VKRELGVAHDTKFGERVEKKMEIVGKQLANGTALPITISSWEVRGALEPVVSEIISAVRRVIEDSQPEVTADMYYSGVTLTGGGALPARYDNERAGIRQSWIRFTRDGGIPV